MFIRLSAWATLALALAVPRTQAQVSDSVAHSTAPTPAAQPPTPDHDSTPPVHVTSVPEPGSVLLLAGPAAVGWVLYWRRRWRSPNGTMPQA